ncbi:hypothetical protein EMIT0111MI5_380006 [Burkholderia sp. IT-111MI5]
MVTDGQNARFWRAWPIPSVNQISACTQGSKWVPDSTSIKINELGLVGARPFRIGMLSMQVFH